MIHSTHASYRIAVLTMLLLGAAGFPTSAQDNGRPLTLKIGPGTELTPRARVQLDRVDGELQDEDAVREGVDLARRRVGVEGVLLGRVEFQVERELAGNGKWQDVFADYRALAALRVQGGHFKLPFSLDENTSPTNLDFVYRSLGAMTLSPGRDLGVMLHGRLLKRIVRYEGGLFDHDGRGARTSNPDLVFGGRTTAFRLRISPFAPQRKAPANLDDLHVGVAWTDSDVPEGLAGLRGRTVLHASLFTSPYPVNGARNRVGVEARWRPGPASVTSEFMRVTTERRGESVEDADLAPLVATAWYVSGTWSLTGGRKARGLANPARPLFRGGIGNIELAARVEAIAFDSAGTGEVPSTSPRAEVIPRVGDRAFTAGVNWYLNRWIKLQANVVRERLDGTSRTNAAVWSRLFRVQFEL